MKTKLLATLLLAVAPAWVAAQDTAPPESAAPDAATDGSAEPIPASAATGPSDGPVPIEEVDPVEETLEPASAAAPGSDTTSSTGDPEPSTNFVPAEPPSTEPTSAWAAYSSAPSRRGSRDGLNPLERTNRNEVSVFAGRQDVSVTKEDRDVLGYEDQNAIMGASMGLRYRHAMGLGAELAYVAWSTNDAADLVNLAADGFDASVRYAWDPIGVVSLYGQAGAGGRWVDLELDDDGGTLSDSAATWTAHAALGFSVRYAGSRGFVELYNDHGYEAHGDLAFDGARFEDSEARPVDLGSVSLGGYRMRWGFSGGVAW